jgi:tetratricopeptide (TPR) repeat protein
VQLLIGDANAGLEQNQRRELIARLEEQVSLATTLEQLQSVARAIQEATVSMPAESALFRLSAQIDRRLKEGENRRLVEDTIQNCRNLRPREAMELVRGARERLPDDERLLSLEALLQERLQKQSVDERRGEYLARAREALKAGNSKDAVHLLEACEAEGIANAEAMTLLEFARNEEKESTTQNLKRNKLLRAQYLVNQGEYEEAIEFLEAELREGEDVALRMLLDQSTNARQSVGRQSEAALTSAGRLVQAGKIDDALQRLRTLPNDVVRTMRIQIAIAALEEEQKLTLFRMTGRAYAALETDLATGHNIMQRVAAASYDSSATAAVAVAFRTREQCSADRALTAGVQKSESLLRNRDMAGVEILVHQIDTIAELASPEQKAEWKNHTSRLNRKGLLGRS